jgi:hypothetical protein
MKRGCVRERRRVGSPRPPTVLSLTQPCRYWGTFLSTTTSCADIERYFLEFEEDENKAKVFHASGKKWASIRPDVKAWTLENWERWEEDAPEWFSDHFRAAVDDDMIPPASLARLKGGGGGERRRSSHGDHQGASAKVLPVVSG